MTGISTEKRKRVEKVIFLMQLFKEKLQLTSFNYTKEMVLSLCCVGSLTQTKRRKGKEKECQVLPNRIFSKERKMHAGGKLNSM